MQKRNNILLIIIIFSLLFFPLVNAASFDFDNAQYQITRVIDSALGILSPLLEKIIGDYTTSEFFFSKILLLILLIIVFKNLLDKTPLGEDNKKISLIISLIISILAIRFINENDFFEAIFIQYGALGIAITTILPMIIFFYFIHNTKIGTSGRKIFWTLYGATILVLWFSKSTQINSLANWIYGITLLATIIFIVADKKIHGYFGMADFHKFEKSLSQKRIREAKKELDELEDHFRNKRVRYKDYKKEKRDLKDYIKELSEEE